MKNGALEYALNQLKEKDAEIAELRAALSKSATILRTHQNLGTVGKSVLALAEKLSKTV